MRKMSPAETKEKLLVLLCFEQKSNTLDTQSSKKCQKVAGGLSRPQRLKVFAISDLARLDVSVNILSNLPKDVFTLG